MRDILWLVGGSVTQGLLVGAAIAGIVFAGSIGMVPILLFIHYVLKPIGGCD